TLARRLAVAAASLAGDTPDTHHALLTLSSQLEQDIWRPPGTDGTWNNYPVADGPYVYWKNAHPKILIVDADARRVLRTLTVQGAPLSGTGMTQDGRRLLTLQRDGTLTFWDMATGTPQRLPFRHQVGVGLWLSPDGTKLIRSANGAVTVLESATGRELSRVRGRAAPG
ncbi:hypothetical protein ACFQ07_03775, partial [Actinomadura adrarensis]